MSERTDWRLGLNLNAFSSRTLNDLLNLLLLFLVYM